MKHFYGLVVIMAVTCMLSSCVTVTHRQEVEPSTTTIGINKQEPEKLGEWVKCHVCKGDGNCADCKGKGKRNDKSCTRCGGTGRCQSCDGQGGYRAEVKK